jgi:hypothetical protein
MNEHVSFLRLAATAVDFQLDPHDARTLDQHLQGCDICRRTAESLRGDAAALRSLPRRSPSPRVAAAIARAARGEARSGRSPLLMLSLGFLLVAGLAGAIIGGAAIRQALESDAPAPTPRATDPAVVPSPLPSVTDRVAEPSATPDPRLGIEWQVVTPEGLGYAQAVTAGGPGLVAVGRPADRGGCEGGPTDGFEPDQCWGGAWISSDGVRWQEAPRQASLEIGTYFPTSGPGVDMIGVAAGSDSIVAIGYAMAGGPTIDAGGELRPAVWTSPDGLQWERVADETVFERARFSEVAATPDGFAIVGAVYDALLQAPGQPRGAIWTSADGREWQRVPDGPIFDIGGYQVTGEDPGSGGPRRITMAGSSILSVGSVCNDQGLDCVTAFWSSPDGSTWQRVVLAERNVNARDIAVTADGFVAVGIASNTGGCGLDLSCTAAVFTSTDGRSWQRQQVEVPEGMIAPDAFSDVVVVGGRIIAISVELEPDGLGQSEAAGAGAIWWSTDGTLWSPLEGVPADFTPAHRQPFASGRDRIVIIADTGAGETRVLISPPE